MPSRSRRVRQSLLQRVSEAGDLAGVVAASDAVLRNEFAVQGSAWGTVDPATTLSTSCARFGVLDIGPEGAALAVARENLLFELEWVDEDPHTFWDLTRRQVTAAALRTAVPDPRRVRRYNELLQPAGIHDELRIRLAADDGDWATAILYRFEQRPFTPDDVAVAAAVAPWIARAVRTALLHAVCDSPAVETPPGSLLIGPDGELEVSSAAAEELLALLPEQQVRPVLTNLASATRARGAGSLTVAAPGAVLAFHASPAKGNSSSIGAVVERPRPIQLAPLIMRAVGFTNRERDVAEAVLQGLSRTQLARRLRMSEHTVGDHLRHLYRKAGVASRSELAALLYRRHYQPPRAAGVPPSPYGYFVGQTSNHRR